MLAELGLEGCSNELGPCTQRDRGRETERRQSNQFMWMWYIFTSTSENFLQADALKEANKVFSASSLE